MFPTLLKLGPFTLHSLWLCVVIAILVSTLLTLKKAKYQRMDVHFLLDHSLSLLISAAFFSRLVFALTNWGYFGPPSVFGTLTQIISFWEIGYSFWGAVLGFLLVFIWHCRRKGESPMDWLETTITPLFIGIMIGNFGQFLDGQAYGKETILPWGIVFESTNVKYTVPIHPTQIYSIIIIAAILLTKKKVINKWPILSEKYNWTIFALSTYALARFLLEFVRGDDTFQIGPVRIGHIVTFLLFAHLSRVLYKRVRKTNPHKK
ncbi:hypothetical protein HN748_04560 [Candidatus Peregrinibacteria bacterium]|jgi:phosphatidylglycerol---prolipoprotein diacylglyceryl transferase|nr:hypothetical protein [Candidatus Peregrinibacteria bacterium]MBT7483814.1 hypothetical protein [Candidatus Peregrinibacteria bacterium]MBT7703481.1 hypothetical protein [Candidatus Peregrinibacteria bacterium]